MIRTFVCEKEGCSGNTFYLQNKDNKLHLTCNQCQSSYYEDISNHDFIMMPNCSKCNSEVFKIFRDIENKGVYVKCIECGGVPEKIYVDSDGVQVSYEAKLLNELKDIMCLIEQRISSVEMNINTLERGQGIVEQSLAYINRYIVEKD